MQTVHATDGRTQIVDVFGPTVEFLTPPTEREYCVLKGTIATTGATLGKFFLEVGRLTGPGNTLPPPTAVDLERFQRISPRSGQWMASPAENAAVGLTGF